MGEITGLFGFVGFCFLVVLSILWILVPFAIFGVKPLLRDLLAEQRKANALLMEIGKNTIPHQ
jgi:hypothetical protein